MFPTLTPTDEKLLSFDQETLEIFENHQMHKSDKEAVLVRLHEFEHKMQVKITEFSRIFDKIIEKLNENKAISSEKQQLHEKLSNQMKSLIKARDGLVGRYNNVKLSQANSLNKLNELSAAVIKSNDQLNRYKNLIGIFEKEIEDSKVNVKTSTSSNSSSSSSSSSSKHHIDEITDTAT